MPIRFLAGPLIVLALALLYFAAGRLGLAMIQLQVPVTTVWAPSGIALAAVLVFGRRALPGVALGSLAVNWSTGTPAATALVIAAGATLGAFAGARLLEGKLGFDRHNPHKWVNLQSAAKFAEFWRSRAAQPAAARPGGLRVRVA